MPTLNKKSGLKSWAQRPKVVEVAWGSKEQYDFHNGTAWRNCRKSYADSHPLCEVSLSEGKHHAAKEIDHVIPVRFGGAKYHPQNLCSMTVFYHRRKTGMEKARQAPIVAWVETEWGLVPKNRDELFGVLKR